MSQREGLTTVTDALSAKANKLSPGLEGVKVLPSGPWFAAGVLTAPLLHGKKVDKTLTVHVELGKTSLNYQMRHTWDSYCPSPET